MNIDAVCEFDICVGECICKPWNECLDTDAYKKCLGCKAPLTDKDDPEFCEKCMSHVYAESGKPRGE